MPPRLHAIFHRQVEGDEALLALARDRFGAAGLLPEFYPGTPDELAREMAYPPLPGRPASVHLPRDIRLLDRQSHERVLAFAGRFGREAAGLVVHDQYEVVSRFDD